MLDSGLTLIKSLEILKEQLGSSAMLEIIGDIISEIEEGKNLSHGLSKYPDVFSQVYISIVKSAEASGLLDQALLRMAENLEKQAKLRNTIKAALTYPVIVITLMIGVVFVMMTVVIPQLTTLYESLDVELPLPTKIVIGLSSFMVTFWPFIIVGVCLSIFLFTDGTRLR